MANKMGDIVAVFDHTADSLTIHITEVEEKIYNAASGRVVKTTDGELVVSRTVIETETTLLQQLELNHAGELVMDEWSVPAVQLWMTILHGEESDDELRALAWDPRQLWFFATFWEAYIRSEGDYAGNLSTATQAMRNWFATWYNEYTDRSKALFGGTPDVEDLGRLIIPAFHIGVPKSFMDMTYKWFMHSTGKQSYLKVQDESQKGILEIDNRLLGQLSAARGNMIGKLERDLALNEARDFLCDSTWCKTQMLFAYLTALKKTTCWPVSNAVHKMSIYATLQHTGREFSFVSYSSLPGNPPKTPSEAKMPGVSGTGFCHRCHGREITIKARLEEKVQRVVRQMLHPPYRTRWIFQGLCIDCINTTTFGDWDDDYWRHVGEEKNYDMECTVKHGQPTWYFSFMGRKEDMHKYKQDRQKKFATKHGKEGGRRIGPASSQGNASISGTSRETMLVPS